MLGNRAKDEKWFEDAFLFCCSPRHRDHIEPSEVQNTRIPPRGMPSHGSSTQAERYSAGSEASTDGPRYLRVRSFSAQKGYHWTKIAVHQADAQEAVPFPAEHAHQDKKGPKVLSKLDPGYEASIKAREIGTFDELSGKPDAKLKQPPISNPMASPPESSALRLGSTGLVGNSWIVEDYQLGGVMNLKEILPTNTLWITGCEGDASDPFVVNVSNSVQSVSIFKCSNLVVKCNSTESVLFQDCFSTTIEVKECPKGSPPFASWDRCRACILLTKDGTPADSFRRSTVCVSSRDISVIDSQGDEYEVISTEESLPEHPPRASKSASGPIPTPAPRPSIKEAGKALKAKVPARDIGVMASFQDIGVLASFQDVSDLHRSVAQGTGKEANQEAPVHESEAPHVSFVIESEAGKEAPGDVASPSKQIVPVYPSAMAEPLPPSVTPADPTPREVNTRQDELYQPLDVQGINLTESYPLVASPPSSSNTPAPAQSDAASVKPPGILTASPPVSL